MPTLPRSPLTLCALVLGLASPAAATTTIDTDTTLTTTIFDSVAVIDAATLTIDAGGGVFGTIEALGSSALVLNEGSAVAFGASIREGSSMLFTGGLIGGLIDLYDGSSLVMTGGTSTPALGPNEISLYGGSTATFSGGSAGSLLIDGGTANVSGGALTSAYLASPSANMYVSGGSLQAIQMWNGGTLEISGGETASLLMLGPSSATLLGGTLGDIAMLSDGVLHISGGTLGGLVQLSPGSSGAVVIHGNLTFTAERVFGTLQDGTSLGDGLLYADAVASATGADEVTLFAASIGGGGGGGVPEPAGPVLGGLALVAAGVARGLRGRGEPRP